MFNGSASLRDAAGYLIENVTKAVRRKQTVDDAFLEKLYSDTASLYHLGQLGSSNGVYADKATLGKLPTTSVILLSSLAVVWIFILIYVVFGAVKKKMSQKRTFTH